MNDNTIADGGPDGQAPRRRGRTDRAADNRRALEAMEADAIRTLAEAGGHLAGFHVMPPAPDPRTGETKRAKRPVSGWGGRRNAGDGSIRPGLSAEDVLAFMRQRPPDGVEDLMPGMMPSSIGCFVVDVDAGGEAAVAEVESILGEPLARHATSNPGRFHMWYRADGAPLGNTGRAPGPGDVSYGNPQWRTADGAGEVKCDGGLVVLWRPDVVAGLLPLLDEAPPADPSLLPGPSSRPPRGAHAGAGNAIRTDRPDLPFDAPRPPAGLLRGEAGLQRRTQDLAAEAVRRIEALQPGNRNNGLPGAIRWAMEQGPDVWALAQAPMRLANAAIYSAEERANGEGDAEDFDRTARNVMDRMASEEHGIDAEAVRRGGDAAVLAAMARPADAPPLPLPAEPLEAVDPPAREWLIAGVFPAGRLSALYGTGGAGKSRLALQIAASVMHGGPAIRAASAAHGGAAIPVAEGIDAGRFENDYALCRPGEGRGRVLWLTWEDEAAEVIRRWRMAHRAGAIREPFPDPDRLSLVDMRKIGGALWGPREGLHVSTAAGWTTAGRGFLATLEGHALAIIDPLAAAYASSEIDRALVRAFTSALDAAAEASGCAVLLLGHPSKGETSGGYSGSTDWQASVRSMLHLGVAETGTGGLLNDNSTKREKAPAYRLRHAKNSYAGAQPDMWLGRRYAGRADGGEDAEGRDGGEGDGPQLAWFAMSAREAARLHEDGRAGPAGGDAVWEDEVTDADRGAV